MSLMASRIYSGDELLTTPYTLFATAGAISEIGARPVFADIEESTCNIDVQQISEFVARRPEIRAINIPVVEDAVQSIGAEYKNGCAVSIGPVGAFSFYPTKNLGGTRMAA
jgi:dTDP-4-amino-4,6-dideoxygalactose transaminase